MKEFDPGSLFPYSPIIDRAPIAWPNGARVAVWVIPNIEHFHLELTNPAPDIRNYSRRDYGNRVGIWRLMEMLTKNGVRGTVALNGEVAIHYPRIMEEAIKLKWELMGHGIDRPHRPRQGRGSGRDRQDQGGDQILWPADEGLARTGVDGNLEYARSSS
jgi:peptidoglycan/xylan/chitin deacetylase (PgdA/CDA1 family)